MRSIIIILTILFLFNPFVSSQSKTNTSISGKVFDKSTNQPLEYSTVSVINKESGKTINGSIADVHGNFVVTDVPYGTYKVDINFIGYEKSTIDSISLKPGRRSVSLGTTYLASSMHNLQGVTITGDKPIIENKIDKTVYNAANDITSQGGLAIDVLKKVPQVTVDIDGNVELQGNSNIRFLINGKPSSVFGNSLADALASIPASQIKSIEAITTPGAKYDSQGTGGIINIILQDNNVQGVNGNINLSAGSRLENGSANFNFRHNKFGINAFFSGNGQLKSQVPYSQNRVSTDTIAKSITSLSQNGLTNFVRNGFRSGLGFDWDISKTDNITGSLGYNQFSNRNLGLTNQEQLVEDYYGAAQSDLITVRNSESHFKIRSIDVNLAYKKKFKKEGQELDIVYTQSNGNPYSNYNQTQSNLGESLPFSGQKSINPGTDNETTVSVDYAQPLSKNFLIETGAKVSDQNLTSLADVSIFLPITDQYTGDPLQSYDLKYKMRVYAGYLSVNFKLFNFLDIKSGARYEATNVKIDYPNTSIPAYGTFVPTIVFSHNFDKNKTLKLAYSKRIERPEYRELNPFINLSDPFNISTGNLFLKPEIGNNFELGYNTSFKKGGNLYVSLIERINTHDKKQITTFYSNYLIGDSTYNNVSVTTNENVGEEYNSGISVSGSYPITSKLNLRGNLMITHRYQVTHLPMGNLSTGIRTRFNMNATYQLPKDLVLELFGFYSSAAKSLQGKSPQFFMYTFAFRKLFWNKNGSIGFTATNPFSKYVSQVSTTTTDNSVSDYIRKVPLRSFGVSFTYKFGKLEFSKKKEGSDNNVMEDNTRF
jgi:outer membrane receptor protein involved in Fe transport